MGDQARTVLGWLVLGLAALYAGDVLTQAGVIDAVFPAVASKGLLGRGGSFMVMWSIAALGFLLMTWIFPKIPYGRATAMRLLGRGLVTLLLLSLVSMILYLALYSSGMVH